MNDGNFLKRVYADKLTGVFAQIFEGRHAGCERRQACRLLLWKYGEYAIRIIKHARAFHALGLFAQGAQHCLRGFKKSSVSRNVRRGWHGKQIAPLRRKRFLFGNHIIARKKRGILPGQQFAHRLCAVQVGDECIRDFPLFEIDFSAIFARIMLFNERQRDFGLAEAEEFQ